MSSMSDRDRKILLGVIPVVVIVAYWFLLLAPTRKEASAASAERTQQEQRRDSAKAEVAAAASAKTDFRSDYTQIVRLGKAIPAQVDMPSLLVQLEGAAKGTGIRFTKILQGERTALEPPAAPAATAGTPAPEGSGESTTRRQPAASRPRAGPVRLPRAPTTQRPSPASMRPPRPLPARVGSRSAAARRRRVPTVRLSRPRPDSRPCRSRWSSSAISSASRTSSTTSSASCTS